MSYILVKVYTHKHYQMLSLDSQLNTYNIMLLNENKVSHKQWFSIISKLKQVNLNFKSLEILTRSQSLEIKH
jgi:hypothetical protein